MEPGCAARAPAASRVPSATRPIHRRGNRRLGSIRPSIGLRIGLRTIRCARAGSSRRRRVGSGHARSTLPRGSFDAGRNRHAPQTPEQDPASHQHASPANSGYTGASPLCTHRPANVSVGEDPCSRIRMHERHAEPEHPNPGVSSAAPDPRTGSTQIRPAPRTAVRATPRLATWRPRSTPVLQGSPATRAAERPERCSRSSRPATASRCR